MMLEIKGYLVEEKHELHSQIDEENHFQESSLLIGVHACKIFKILET